METIFDSLSLYIWQLAGEGMDAIMKSLISGFNFDLTAGSATGSMNAATGPVLAILNYFYPFFFYLALLITIFLFTFQLVRTFAGPVSQAESPFMCLWRLFISILTILLLRPLLGALFNLMNVLYTYLINLDIASQVTVLQSLVGSDRLADSVQSVISSQYTSTGSGFITIACTIIILVMAIELFKLLLEVIERWLILMFLYFTCPLPCAALASSSTSNIFSSWSRMLFSQCILMLFSVIFFKGFSMMCTFCGSASFDSITLLFLMVSWLKLGQRIDQHMSALGLSTAQAGGGLANSLFGGVNTVLSTIRTADSFGRMAERSKAKRDGASNGVGKPAYGKDMPSNAHTSTSGKYTPSQMGDYLNQNPNSTNKGTMDGMAVAKSIPSMVPSMNLDPSKIDPASAKVGAGYMEFAYDGRQVRMERLDGANSSAMAQGYQGAFVKGKDGHEYGIMARDDAGKGVSDIYGASKMEAQLNKTYGEGNWDHAITADGQKMDGLYNATDADGKAHLISCDAIYPNEVGASHDIDGLGWTDATQGFSSPHSVPLESDPYADSSIESFYQTFPSTRDMGDFQDIESVKFNDDNRGGVWDVETADGSRYEVFSGQDYRCSDDFQSSSGASYSILNDENYVSTVAKTNADDPSRIAVPYSNNEQYTPTPAQNGINYIPNYANSITSVARERSGGPAGRSYDTPYTTATQYEQRTESAPVSSGYDPSITNTANNTSSPRAKRDSSHSDASSSSEPSTSRFGSFINNRRNNRKK